ncbi:MAG: laccase domain-containing protein, partial [Bacteroidota bacterium]
MREVVFHGAGFDLPLLRSEVLPDEFRHGFTTRLGGVSDPPFDSFNLGGRWGDAAASVAENRRRLFEAAGGGGAAGGRCIFFASQVHGADSVVVEAGDGAGAGDGDGEGATSVDAVARLRADAGDAATAIASPKASAATAVLVMVIRSLHRGVFATP